MRFVTGLVVAAGVLVTPFASAGTAPEEKTGLRVGAKAPAFALKDQDGKERTLEELTKGGGLVAAVFHRSASWWPFCQKQLVQLQKDLPALEAKKVRVVAISYDSVTVLEQFAKKRKITFPLLSDPGSKTIAAYGLTNKEAKGKAAGVPYPGTMLIDQDGVIRAKLFYDGYRERHTAEDILKAAREIK